MKYFMIKQHTQADQIILFGSKASTLRLQSNGLSKLLLSPTGIGK
jgi:hypothetical protein